MADLYTPIDELPHIPDDLNLAQFMLDYDHDIRPANATPCLVENDSGCRITLEMAIVVSN